MGIISTLTPLNLAEEYQRFFSDFTYNPQFEYSELIPRSVLEKWGLPKPIFTEYAQHTLENISDLTITRTEYANEDIAQRCRVLLSTIGVTEDIEIRFIPHKVTRCSISKQSILFQDKPKFASDTELEGTLNHEVQTHLLRNLNQQKQAWHLDREHQDGKILRTEEGLAVLHASLPQPLQKFWRSSAYYLAVDLSLQHSFSEAFHRLRAMGIDAEFAWRLCLRTKRGLTDTSLPGANTKDLCYLEGAFKVWHWIVVEKQDPQDLYLGKIFIEELEEKKILAKTKVVYPPLFMKKLEDYRSALFQIGDINGLHFLEKGNHE